MQIPIPSEKRGTSSCGAALVREAIGLPYKRAVRL
jgi:hypothetical protein